MGIQEYHEASLDVTSTGTVDEAQPNGAAKVTVAVDGDATYALEVKKRDEADSAYVEAHEVASGGETVDLVAGHVRLVVKTVGTGTDDVYFAVGSPN